MHNKFSAKESKRKKKIYWAKETPYINIKHTYVADSVCVHCKNTHTHTHATLLSNTSLHNMYFRLPFLLYYICIQHVTTFCSLSLSLVTYRSKSSERSRFQRFFQDECAFMAMYVVFFRIIIICDVNLTISTPIVLLLLLPLILLLLFLLLFFISLFSSWLCLWQFFQILHGHIF